MAVSVVIFLYFFHPFAESRQRSETCVCAKSLVLLFVALRVSVCLPTELFVGFFIIIYYYLLSYHFSDGASCGTPPPVIPTVFQLC